MCGPVILFLGVYPREMKTCIHRKTLIRCQNSFIHNIPELETTQISSTNEWVHELWYVHSMHYFSAIKRSYWYMQGQEWILKMLCWVKEPRHKWVYTVWPYRINLWWQKSGQGLFWKGELAGKGMGELSGVMQVFYQQVYGYEHNWCRLGPIQSFLSSCWPHLELYCVVNHFSIVKGFY